MVHRAMQQWDVNLLRPAHDEVLLLADFAFEKDRDRCGHERKREEHRPDERDQNGERHGHEHFPFDAGEGEDRQIDDHDDEAAEDARRNDFAGGAEDHAEALGARQRAWF